MKYIFIICLLFSYIANPQTVYMNIQWMDNNISPDKESIDAANKTLENDIRPKFVKFLQEQNNKNFIPLENDTIEITFCITDLYFDGFLIKIKTPNLLFRNFSKYYGDAKGTFLSEIVKLHYSINILDYPNIIYQKNTENYFYIKYFLQDSKEIIFRYYDTKLNESLPALYLMEIKYSSIGKKKTFLNADFARNPEFDMYEFDSNFTKYIKDIVTLK